LEGGSFASSVSSFWMRLVMLMFRMWVWTCLFNSRFCISIYILYGIFCISIFLIDKIKIKIKPSSNYSIQYFEVILKTNKYFENFEYFMKVESIAHLV
jgi:hypothetical protein